MNEQRTPEEIADRMVMYMLSDLGTEDEGTITIGPHNSDEQCWQLRTRNSDDASAKMAAGQIRLWIRNLIQEERADLARLRAELDAENKRAEEAEKVCKECAATLTQAKGMILDLTNPPGDGVGFDHIHKTHRRIDAAIAALAAYDAARKEPPHA